METESGGSIAPPIPTITLSNGVEMPQLAIGTAPLSLEPGDDASNPRFVGFYPERVYMSVHAALSSGVRHVDAALLYRSHGPIAQVLGRWFGEGKLRREDVFITTKVYHPPTPLGLPGDFVDADEMTAEDVGKTVEAHCARSLKELGVGYVDLMLLHWPGPGGGAGKVGGGAPRTRSKMSPIDPARRRKRMAAWQALERCYSLGWARSVGVSNFHEVHLDHLTEDGAAVLPMVNQLEASVYIEHDGIVDYCRERGIAVMAYSPFGRGVMSIDEDPVVRSVAEKHGVSPGVVALGYLLRRGFTVTFLSSSPERIRSNVEVVSLRLDDEDMGKLRALNRSASWGLPSPYELP